MSLNKLPHTTALLEQGIAQGLHLGAQVYVSHKGQAVADFGMGQARVGVPMTNETIMLWLSATKPTVAVAIGQLWERGKLGLDDLVTNYLPEFGQKGKQAITIRHLLTHTSGFRAVTLSEEQPWATLIEQICATPLEAGWVVGQTAGYHSGASWFILGELVQRISGRPLSQYMREEIFLPLQMRDCWLGMPLTRFEAYGERIGLMYDTRKGEPRLQTFWNTPQEATSLRPGGNAHGPMRELGRFYEALLNGGQLAGRRILSPQTVEAMTAHQRVGSYDLTFKHMMDWGLGFIPDNNRYGVETVPYGYGRYCSPRTFGHGGFQSSIAYADPEHQLAVAFVCNGAPGDARHNRRHRELNSAIYEDLGLAS